MHKLIFNLAQLECAGASWKLAAGDRGGSTASLRRATRLLQDLHDFYTEQSSPLDQCRTTRLRTSHGPV
jgi:hypothetical protein